MDCQFKGPYAPIPSASGFGVNFWVPNHLLTGDLEHYVGVCLEMRNLRMTSEVYRRHLLLEISCHPGDWRNLGGGASHTVDGSEIPFPTTWDGYKTV